MKGTRYTGAMEWDGFRDRMRDRVAELPRSQENVLLFESVGSTNAVGSRLVAELQRDGTRLFPTLIAAWQQTAGRGRQGRTWSSPPGSGVYASLLLEIEGGERLQSLPMLTGTALASCLFERGCKGVKLKWPNDLWAEGGKLGGILIETVTGVDGEPVAVIGFGINRCLGDDEGVPPHAVSLEQLTSAELPELPELVLDLAAQVQQAVESWQSVASTVELYREWCLHRAGDLLRFKVGGETVEGSFVGLDERGWVILETEAGERHLGAGEVLETSRPSASEES